MGVAGALTRESGLRPLVDGVRALHERHRGRLSLAALSVGTLTAARVGLRDAPWSASTGWAIAVALAVVVLFWPRLAVFGALSLLAVQLAETSPGLTVLEMIIACVFLAASAWSSPRIGFWTPLALLVPWAISHDLAFLPLFVGVFLSPVAAAAWALPLALQTGLWGAILGRPAGFISGPTLDATVHADLGAWALAQLEVPSDLIAPTLQPWLRANVPAAAAVLVAMLVAAILVSRVMQVRVGPRAARDATAVAGGTVVASGALGYLAVATLSAQGVVAGGLFAAFASCGLGWVAGVLLEPPPDPLARPVAPKAPPTRWGDIGGYADVKAEIRQAVAPFADARLRAEMERSRLPITKGILLFGPPGVGKTMFARAIATETRMHFISVGGAEFFTKWLGESEQRLRAIFEEAKAKAPSAIFFDELESFLQPRELAQGSSVGDVLQRVVATFLSEMDGFIQLGGVLVIGATNFPDQLDAAAIRPGRFDKLIFIPPPDPDARRAIWRAHLAGRPGAEAIDVEKLVSASERYTGADVGAVVTQCYRASVGTAEQVTTDKLIALVKQTKPTVTLDMLDRYEALARKYGRRGEVTERKPLRERERLGWDDVAGMDDVKAMLRETVELPLTHPEVVAEYKLRPTRGVLLFGPPGCGKTLFARTLADASHATFLSVRGPELLRSAVGESEKRVRDLFREARENRPCIVFFDEIDALAGRRDEGLGTLQVVNQLLTEMDGMEDLTGVVVLAATNRPDAIEGALLRPGRFDRLVYVGLPDLASRRAQIVHHLAGRPAEVDVDAVAQRAEGCTGAEIAFVANEAALGAARAALAGDPRPIRTDDLVALIDRTPRSVSAADLERYEALRTLQR